MKILLLTSFIIISCQTTGELNSADNKAQEPSNNKLIVQLINLYLNNLDSANIDDELTHEIWFYPELENNHINFFRSYNDSNKILEDSLVLPVDSLDIIKSFDRHRKNSTTPYIQVFAFSNFVFDSTMTNAFTNFSLYWYNKEKNSIRGGHESIVIFQKEENNWKIKNERMFIEY